MRTEEEVTSVLLADGINLWVNMKNMCSYACPQCLTMSYWWNEQTQRATVSCAFWYSALILQLFSKLPVTQEHISDMTAPRGTFLFYLS